MAVGVTVALCGLIRCRPCKAVGVTACLLLSPYAALSLHSTSLLDMLCIDLSLVRLPFLEYVFHQSWNFVLFVIPSPLPGQCPTHPGESVTDKMD